MKRPAAAPAFNPFPTPKKGKQRMMAKSVKKTVNKPKAMKVPAYVRHGMKSMKSRADRDNWCINVEQILSHDENDMTKRLIDDGYIPDLENTTCPKCGTGTLGALRSGRRGQLSHRCNKKACHQYIVPHINHPIFTVGQGVNGVPLKRQAAVVLCILAGTSNVATRRVLGTVNHKVIEKIRTSLHFHVKKYVLRKQKNMTFGDKKVWKDVEGDETTVAKKTDPSCPSNACTDWEQYAGLIERGSPESLVLFKTSPSKTDARAPGPGAIRKTDWKPIADKYIKDRKVILHTDKARSYKAKISGVLHDSVRHCKKRVKVKGKWVWKQPVYTKKWTHTAPNGQKIQVKAGTQIIDRAWRSIKSHLTGISSAPGSSRLEAAVRYAQWVYWNRGKDLWKMLGEVLADSHK